MIPKPFRLCAVFAGIIGFLGCGRSLNNDRVWEAEILSKDDVHEYYLDLAAAEFAMLEVRQLGVDVELEIFDVSTGYTQVVDRPTGDWGLDWVPIFCRTPGRFKIMVRPIGLFPKQGRYELKVSQRRRGTAEKEGQLAYAEQLYLWAYQISEGTPENAQGRRKARLVQAYLDALPYSLCYYTEQQNQARQADILHLMGEVLNNLDRQQEAIAVNGQALRLYRQIGDLQEVTKSLVDMGLYYYHLGAYEPALDQYFRALWLAREEGNRSEEANILNNISQVFKDIRMSGLTLGFLTKALEIDSQSPKKRAQQLRNISQEFISLGDLDMAASYMDQALQAYQALGRHAVTETRKKTLEYGDIFLDMGDLDTAEGWYRSAVMGMDLDNPGEIQDEYHLRMGDLYRLRDQPKLAIEAYNKTLDLKQIPPPNTSYSLSRAYFAAYMKDRDPDWLQSALNILNAALDDKVNKGNQPNSSQKANLLYMLALVLWKCENLAAEAYLTKAKVLIENARVSVNDHSLRQSFFAVSQVFYALEIHIAMGKYRKERESKWAERALNVFEEKTARSLLEVVADIPPHNPVGLDPVAVERFWSIKHHFPVISNAIRSDQILDPCWNEILPLPCDAKPNEIVPEQILNAEAILKLADEDTLILNYNLGEYASFLWAVSRDEVRGFELPPRSLIQDLVSQVRDHFKRSPLSRRNQDVDQAMDRLSRYLLGPVFPFGRFKRLAVVSSDTLQLLPFSALPVPYAGEDTPTQPLLEVAEVVSIPSNSVLAAMRRKVQGTPEKSIAIFFDPVFNGKDPRVRDLPAIQGNDREGDLARLPLTRNEARKIIELDATSGSDSFMAEGFGANVETAINGGLANYRIIHFATHGVIDTANPSRSKLVLSRYGPDGSRIEGALNLTAISNMKLKADLVVLSACDTAIGREIRGEGLISLARGFMFAGAPRVVGSLWQVADQSTAELMAVFYQKMLEEGLTPAAALRAAQRALRQHPQWRDPFYWSGFVLIGDWR